jgi:hypothetical protein
VRHLKLQLRHFTVVNYATFSGSLAVMVRHLGAMRHITAPQTADRKIEIILTMLLYAMFHCNITFQKLLTYF